MNQRDTIRGGLILGAGAAATPGIALEASTDCGFPDDVRWECATAAHQIDSAVDEDAGGKINGKRYGLHHVDVATQRRTSSAAEYREVTRQDRLV